MKKFKLNWYSLTGLCIILCGIFTFALSLTVIDISKENRSLKEKIAGLEEEVDAKQDLIFERNNELYLCNMEKEEWKELFYSEIDFHPYEGPDW